MNYQDKIYGQIEINEPLIEDLFRSETLGRLKRVNQYGASFYRFSHLTTTRFEHCAGVYYLLKRFGANVEEQAAGLLHDVPHTVFSHVIDFVFSGGESSSFHEQFHEYFLHDSDAVKILAKYKIDWHRIYQMHHYKLLEQDMPSICMDRLDYFFRDMYTDQSLTLDEINKILNDLVVRDEKIVFQNFEIARFAAEKFREGNNQLWGHPLQATLYRLFAEALKIALFDNIITFRDLFSTDEEVYNKLMASQNQNIVKRLTQIKNLKIQENKVNYDYHIKTKIRYLDPYVIQNQELVRLSVLDAQFHKDTQDYLAEKEEGFYVKIV
jgi:HD superfamily phosphohydrolase